MFDVLTMNEILGVLNGVKLDETLLKKNMRYHDREPNITKPMIETIQKYLLFYGQDQPKKNNPKPLTREPLNPHFTLPRPTLPAVDPSFWLQSVKYPT